MKTKNKGNASKLTLVVCLLSLAGSALNAQTVEYEVTILPPIPDSFGTIVLSMNNHGELVGRAQLPRNPFFLRGWKWSAAEGMVLLPAPPGIDALRYSASDINDAGVIAGDGGGDSGEAWRFQNGEYTLLGTIEGDPLSTSGGINENGDIVGYSGNPSFGRPKHFFRYTNQSGMVSLLSGRGRDINDLGVMTGYKENTSGVFFSSFLLSPPFPPVFLGFLPGRNDSFAHGINELGQVVGTSRSSESSQAFVYTDGVGMQGLPTVSRWNSAGAINSMGHIVGGGADPRRGYVWTPSTGSRVLTDLIDPALQITVDNAVDINDSGQIAARGFDVGNRVFVQLLLTPVGACEACDMNCDGAIDALDIEPFLNLLFGGGNPCGTCTGDVNGDGRINASDIEPFLACLFG